MDQMTSSTTDWQNRVVSPKKALEQIEPGMSIFLGTGVGEPRTLVKHLMASEASNLMDLELIQIVSFGDAISLKSLQSQRYRLKTFFSGWVASEAIATGRVDLIPSRFSDIPMLIESGQLPVDAAFIQITPPNEAGYCSFGIAGDVSRQVMERASLVIGEINSQIPQTFGDTFVPVSDFHFLVHSTDPPLYFERWPVNEIIDRVAENVASVIEDGSCIAYSIGSLFDALSPHLARKRHLGIHTAIFTDALMDLVKSGAVTNRYKNTFRGKSLACYGFGTPEMLCWLDRNPLVEFQGIDRVISPILIGRNPRFVAILPARKVDISGRIAFHIGKGNVSAGPGEAMDFFNGAEISRGGYTVFALPSRNLKNEPNILLSVEHFPNEFGIRESVNLVVTEYGVASLKGRTLRERAQALIEIAHPDDRPGLIEQAKAENILYADQIYIAESAHLYPSEISTRHTFKGGTTVRFRAIRPSDEEEMRRLFYRFSDKAVYYRYFSPIKTMPHAKMQQYVNVDFRETLSIVGLAGDTGEGQIIAEARFVKHPGKPYGDVAFVVDEKYQGIGIASYLYAKLIRLAKERGLQGFTADVLTSNKSMMKVFEKGGQVVKANLSSGVYELTISFSPESLPVEEVML
jgi:acyl-CoA hydrolase/GNAT superfamily N-acetyltransferase